jgi:transcriptional regulator with XRE-family HTH domain
MKEEEPGLADPDDFRGFKARSRTIGMLLRHRRIQRKYTLQRCAEQIDTTRQRYADIESGESDIRFVELEELSKFLDFEPNAIWPAWRKDIDKQKNVTKVQVEAGQAVTIVVEAVEPSNRGR